LGSDKEAQKVGNALRPIWTAYIKHVSVLLR
jgi:hypothetical protein